MGLPNGPAEHLRAGTWVWLAEKNRFLGDRIVADLLGIDAAVLKDGVSIETIYAAVHPDDLKAVLAAARMSIDDHVSYRSHFRIRRANGLLFNVISTGQGFFEDGHLVQFAGTLIEVGPVLDAVPTVDRLTEQVIAACHTARVLGEPYRLQLLEMVLFDIGKTTARRLQEPAALSSSH